MKRIPARGETTKGLDVSHYDESIDFNQVKAAGFAFCSAKCTEGVSVIDRNYKTNKARARVAGLLFGAYHFFRPAQDPVAQANHFLSHADIQPGDMIPMLDWEVMVDRHADISRAQTFLDLVEKRIGKKMIIYGGSSILNDYALPASFKDYPLWVANYGVTAPAVPGPWTFWSFWQYSDKGSVPGIPAANEDMDVFNGPLENVLKFKV